MIITNATWEQKNLGVTTVEITIENGDSVDEIKRTLNELNCEYAVIKIDSGNHEAMFAVQELGYTYIETAFGIEGVVKRLNKPIQYQRFDKALRNEIADDKTIVEVCRQIETGTIFTTDRIAIDPYFSKEIAGKRYSNWIKDELNRGAVMYITYYKDSPVFFDVIRECEESVYKAILGGSISENHTGLGFSGLYMLTDTVKDIGGRKIITGVSSNNLPIIRLHMDMGYTITKSENVFIKHF